MRKVIYTSCFVALLVISSCSIDEKIELIRQEFSLPSSPAEEEAIDVDTLESGFVIEGASLQSGSIQSNNLVSFSIDNEEQTAFQDLGFEIQMQVPSSYAGAMIQVLDSQDQPSQNYYDIPVSGRNSAQARTISTESSEANLMHKNKSYYAQESYTTSARTATNADQDVNITVNFDESISAGSFCYNLYVYDTNQNISSPEKICVEVEEWGGVNDLIGDWQLTKFQDYVNGFDVGVTNIGNPYYDNYTRLCFDESQGAQSIQETFQVDALVLTLEDNGNQNYYYDTKYKWLDFEYFYETCLTTYDIYTHESSPSGKWAYDEEDNTLTLVNYVWEVAETINTNEASGYNYSDEVGLGFSLKLIGVGPNEIILEENIIQNNVVYRSEYYFSRLF